MKKTSLCLVLAGVFAVGAAHAQSQTWDVPQKAGEASTMTMGRPNLETNNIGWPNGSMAVPQNPDVTVMGAAPMTNPDTVVLVPHRPLVIDREGASATFDVPSRAGEASTMTGGVPNLVTNNDPVIARHHHMYSSTTPIIIVR